MPLSPGTAVERYVIEGVIGEGAMAVVYRARHRDLGSLHAIKQLTNRDTQISERLVQEGRLQSTLGHQNVLSVTDLVYIDETPALVMEYVAGPTLQQLMDQEDLSLQQADALVQGLLRGVAAAHAHGLVHRDLKPANVMIAVTESSLVPKIADFGLAKVLQREQTSMQATQSGLAMGTPAYMAPEQIQDSSSVDARADVFALGAILYEIISGTRCFGEDKLLTLWQDICLGRYTPLGERTPDLPPRILKAVEGALAVDREDRIPSVNSLIDVWFEGVTESVDLSPSRSREVWPQAIRDKTAALASKVTQPAEAPSNDSVGLDHTQAAGSSPVPAAPTSVTMIPGEAQKTTASPTGETPRWVWLVGVALLVVGAWAVGRQGPTSQTGTVASEPASSQVSHTATASPAVRDVSPPAEVTPSPRALFSLSSGEPGSAQQRLEKALDALLEGEASRAERLLLTLSDPHPDEAVVHSLLAVTGFFQNRGALSVTASTRSARLARDMEGDLGKALVLADRSWREHHNKDELLRQWKALREQHDEPMVEILYFVSARYLMDHPTFIAQLRASMKKHPDSVALWLLELRRLEEIRDIHGLLKAATAAAQTHPASPILKVKRYAAMAELGQLEAAEVGLKDVLREDGGLVAARLVLADIYLERDLEAERMEQFMLLLSDTTPVTDRLTFLGEHGRSMANRGRLADANKHWRFCVEEGRREGRHHSASICAQLALEAHRGLGVSVADSGWIQQARDILAEPELDPDIRSLHTMVLLWIQAQERLERTPGEPADAHALLERLKAIPKGALPFALKGWLVGEITFALALHTRDTAVLRSLLATWQTSAELAGQKSSCLFEEKRARVGEVLKDDEMVAAALSALASDGCSPHALQGMGSARAQVALAARLLTARQRDDARAQLEAFRAAWPRADEGLPFVRQANTLARDL